MSSSSALDFDKDALIGGVSFVVGLTYASAAINGMLALSASGAASVAPSAVAPVAINTLLGATGVGYYFYRKSGKK